jgi:hypothetical protein
MQRGRGLPAKAEEGHCRHPLDTTKNIRKLVPGSKPFVTKGKTLQRTQCGEFPEIILIQNLIP